MASWGIIETLINLRRQKELVITLKTSLSKVK